jgi:hypothetical protein
LLARRFATQLNQEFFMKFKLGDVCIAISPFPLNDGLKVVIVGVHEGRVPPGFEEPFPYLIRRVGGEAFPRSTSENGHHVWYRSKAIWARECQLLPFDGLKEEHAQALVTIPSHPREWLKALAK